MKDLRVDSAHAIQRIFTPVAPTYRSVNHVLTFGLDGYWRGVAARRVLRHHPATALDICTGTGELASRLHRLGRGRIAVTGVDFCDAMLAEARRHCATNEVLFQRADSTRLPFSDGSFDAVTISFALRNLNVTSERFTKSLGECFRVLRPGGRLITVETTQPPWAIWRWIVRHYTTFVVPRVGTWLSDSQPAYMYLSNTIPRFHAAPAIASILRGVGFDRVDYTYLTFGLVAIHESVKTVS